MTHSQRAVLIEEIPEKCDARMERAVLGRLDHHMNNLVRPAVVLDCSQVRRADKPLVHLLLACLEEALKRNGDVRLAGIRQEVWPSLQTAGVARLFRVFPTTAEAVNSFSRLAAGQRTTVYPDRPAANAA